MAEPTCRNDVFQLLADADFIYRPDTNTWSHHDGRPFTEAEQATVHDATEVELETLSMAYEIGHDHGLGDPAHTRRILRYRYSIKLPDNATDEDILGAMTDQDRARYRRLGHVIRTGIRPDVVTLLLDTDLPAYTANRIWTHHDGRPFTKQEQNLANSCTPQELEAVSAQMQLQVEFEEEQEAAAPRALDDLLNKYYGHLPDCSRIHDPASAMTDEDRAQYRSLLETIAAKPGDTISRGDR